MTAEVEALTYDKEVAEIMKRIDESKSGIIPVRGPGGLPSHLRQPGVLRQALRAKLIDIGQRNHDFVTEGMDQAEMEGRPQVLPKKKRDKNEPEPDTELDRRIEVKQFIRPADGWSWTRLDKRHHKSIHELLAEDEKVKDDQREMVGLYIRAANNEQ